MSIIIKGMDFPKGCALCEFNVYGKCVAMGRSLTLAEYSFDDRVSDDCPLIEIPKGAGLIDARDVKKHMIPLDFSVQNWISEADLDNRVPTIFKEDE